MFCGRSKTRPELSKASYEAQSAQFQLKIFRPSRIYSGLDVFFCFFFWLAEFGAGLDRPAFVFFCLSHKKGGKTITCLLNLRYWPKMCMYEFLSNSYISNITLVTPYQ